MGSRLLVVNSNTSVTATQRIAAGCAGYVRPTTEVSYVNVEAGPQGIDTPLDRAISGLETARVIARHRHTFDAFVVACGMDPGLDAARQVTDKPVVGIAEAGMLMACTLGARFSVLVPMRSSTAPMQDLVAHYGLTSRLASIVPLEMATSELIEGPGALRARVLQAAQTAHARDLAEVVVMTGSVMVGMEREISQDVGIPALSGMVCAIKMAESLADLGARTSHAYTYRTLHKADHLIGYADLQDVYSI